MRNPERIKTLLDCIEEKWNQVPDWRFGQFISNVTAGHNLFYLSDEKLFEILILYFSNPQEIENIEIPEFKEFSDEVEAREVKIDTDKVRIDPEWFF